MWPDENQTRELLNDARRGDPAAIDRLLDRHREALRRMVQLRMDPALERRVDASDIVQDTMLEASRRLAEYLRNSTMPFHLWLRHIARDRLIDAHRRHRVAARRSLDREQPLTAAHGDQSALDLIQQLQDPELTPAAAATQREIARRFQAAIESLDPRDREVVLLRHYEQLSNQETARILGLTEPAAGMRYLRAIRRLRALLSEVPSAGGNPQPGD